MVDGYAVSCMGGGGALRTLMVLHREHLIRHGRDTNSASNLRHGRPLCIPLHRGCSSMNTTWTPAGVGTERGVGGRRSRPQAEGGSSAIALRTDAHRPVGGGHHQGVLVVTEPWQAALLGQRGLDDRTSGGPLHLGLFR